MDSGPKNFGSRLRAQIATQGLSNDEVVAALGISRATLFNWFNRELPPPSKKHRLQLDTLFGAVSVVAEESAPYLTGADAMKASIRDHFERLLAAAGDDPGRLGWLREELIRSLPVPAHWPSGEAPRVLVPVTLPSQMQALSSKTGKPLPPRAKPARSA